MADLYEILSRNETTKSRAQPSIIPLRDVSLLNDFYAQLNIYNDSEVMFPREKRVIGIIGVNRAQSGIYELEITNAHVRGKTLALTLIDQIPEGFKGGSMLSVAGSPVLVASIPYNILRIHATYTPTSGRGQEFQEMKLNTTF